MEIYTYEEFGYHIPLDELSANGEIEIVGPKRFIRGSDLHEKLVYDIDKVNVNGKVAWGSVVEKFVNSREFFTGYVKIYCKGQGIDWDTVIDTMISNGFKTTNMKFTELGLEELVFQHT